MLPCSAALVLFLIYHTVLAMPPAYRSKVWLHATRQDGDTAKCNICSRVVQCKGGNTSNLATHLKRHHNLGESVLIKMQLSDPLLPMFIFPLSQSLPCPHDVSHTQLHIHPCLLGGRVQRAKSLPESQYSAMFTGLREHCLSPPHQQQQKKID